MPAIAAQNIHAWLSTRFLVVGLMGSIGLAVLTVGLPLVELNRLGRTSITIAQDSQRATYYLGEVGHQLARLRFRSLSPGTWAELADIEQRLQVALDRLPGALDGVGGWYWAVVAQDAVRLRAIYREATNLVAAGEASGAAALLASESLSTRRVHDSLDDLGVLTSASVTSRLQAANDDASRAGGIALLLLAAFFAGLVTIFSLMLRELSQQRRRLADYTARLESSNADLDAFAGRVAHDLKNALGPIVMAPDLLRQAGDDAAVRSVADRIERSSRRTIGVVDALLGFSRAGRAVDADEASTPGAVLDSVLDGLAPQIGKLAVHVELVPLPTAAIRCSPGLLQIVLANVCGNAVKYLDGQPERRVRISGAIKNLEYLIAIEDTGPGIPADVRDKIFEPFFRVPGVRAPGSGVGLATVRRIVEARGGRIEVDSELGRGTCFRLWLPLVS